MSQAELLALVVGVLNELQIDHMLVGSHASSFYGEARSTHDIDLVIDLDPAMISELVGKFDSQRYYFSESALREGRMANLIDTMSGDKVDCFLLRDDPVEQLAFSRRVLKKVMDIEIPLASAEDTILAKLKWSDMSGGLPQQQIDVGHIVRAQVDLDLVYLRQQAVAMGLQAQLEEVLDNAN